MLWVLHQGGAPIKRFLLVLCDYDNFNSFFADFLDPFKNNILTKGEGSGLKPGNYPSGYRLTSSLSNLPLETFSGLSHLTRSSRILALNQSLRATTIAMCAGIRAHFSLLPTKNQHHRIAQISKVYRSPHVKYIWGTRPAKE